MKGFNLTQYNGQTICQLYKTIVAVIQPTEIGIELRLDNGGWLTQATCKAINKALAAARVSASVSRKQGVMLLHWNDHTFEFKGTTLRVIEPCKGLVQS